MEGAENVTMPDMTHVSPRPLRRRSHRSTNSFRRTLPRHDIVPQKKISSPVKALEFPQNTGLAGDTVESGRSTPGRTDEQSADCHLRDQPRF